MAESPDFEQLVRTALERWNIDPADGPQWARMLEDLAEQLRQVWNARGAADLDAIDAAVGAGVDTRIARALKGLDR